MGGMLGLSRDQLIKNTHWRVLFIKGINYNVSILSFLRKFDKLVVIKKTRQNLIELILNFIIIRCPEKRFKKFAINMVKFRP